MASQIGWIDFSHKDRDRVKRFLDLMGLGGVVDELGVGMIRDAMSNKIFPGFSTLYTRAKYFFITPYILLERDAKQTKKQTGKDYFQKAEIDTNVIVKQFYENHQERGSESYFGKEKSDGRLKRQPSEIYWNGIQFFHLLETSSSLDQLLLEKRSLMDELLSTNSSDDITKEQGEYTGTEYVNVSFDKNWQQYISKNGLTLTRTEAETLHDRFIKYAPNSLPTALVTDKNLWQFYVDANDEANGSIDNAFVHFVKVAYGSITNDALRENLIRAHDMAIFLHGAHIAYNIQFWENADAPAPFIKKIRDEGVSWLCSLSTKMINYKHFDINDCIKGTNVQMPTRDFLNQVQLLIKNYSKWSDIESTLCALAEKQERWNKKTKSRFYKMDKDMAIKEIDNPQWIGLPLINYRYYSTRSIIKDIYQGLASLNA